MPRTGRLSINFIAHYNLRIPLILPRSDYRKRSTTGAMCCSSRWLSGAAGERKVLTYRRESKTPLAAPRVA